MLHSSLGYNLQFGEGIKDIEKAIYWYERLQNDDDGLYRLGNCYYFGEGI